MSWTGNVREDGAPRHLLSLECFVIPRSFIPFSCREPSLEKICFSTGMKLTRLCFSILQCLRLVSFPMAMAKGCARGKILVCSPEAMADDNHLLSLFSVQSRKPGRTARCRPQQCWIIERLKEEAEWLWSFCLSTTPISCRIISGFLSYDQIKFISLRLQTATWIFWCM